MLASLGNHFVTYATHAASLEKDDLGQMEAARAKEVSFMRLYYHFPRLTQARKHFFSCFYLMKIIVPSFGLKIYFFSLDTLFS